MTLPVVVEYDISILFFLIVKFRPIRKRDVHTECIFEYNIAVFLLF